MLHKHYKFYILCARLAKLKTFGVKIGHITIRCLVDSVNRKGIIYPLPIRVFHKHTEPEFL